METAKELSKTVRLTNEESGLLFRRFRDMLGRIEEGNVELSWVLTEIQRVVEGRLFPEVRYRDTAKPLPFPAPSLKELRRSRTPLEKRLPHSRMRLNYPRRNAERIMAELWALENISVLMQNNGRTSVNAILDSVAPTDHDIAVVGSTLQWLGTNVGRCFLAKFLRVSQIPIS